MAGIRGFTLDKLTSVRMVFSVFDCRATSTREFMRRVTATRVRETNLKCEVIHEVKGDRTPPIVHVKFTDGSELLMEGSTNTALDMVAAINNRTKAL